MATVTVFLPDPENEWIDAQVGRGELASTSDYLRDLVRQDRARRQQELGPEELRMKLEASRRSGEGRRSLDIIFAEARETARSPTQSRG